MGSETIPRRSPARARPADFKARLAGIVGRAHLVYLGLLPSFATFALLYTYGYPTPLLMFLFLGGTVAVSVYLAVVISYTEMPRSAPLSLLFMLDGPAWALASLWSRELTLPVFAVEGFLVDGTAIWLSTLVLALRSDRPTRGQRIATVAFMLVALLATASLVWPYLRGELWGEWWSLTLLGLGVVEAFAVNYKLLERDEVVRDAAGVSVYIAVLVMLWVGSLTGNVFH
jgi:hypothetical protein